MIHNRYVCGFTVASSAFPMIGANPIAPAREHDGRHDGCDVDNLHDREQGVISKYAIAQKECAGNKPD